MTPSLVKASFITRSNTCGFLETGKTNSCSFNHVSFEKTSTIIIIMQLTLYMCGKLLKTHFAFYLEMTCKLQSDIIQSFKLYF